MCEIRGYLRPTSVGGGCPVTEHRPATEGGDRIQPPQPMPDTVPTEALHRATVPGDSAEYARHREVGSDPALLPCRSALICSRRRCRHRRWRSGTRLGIWLRFRTDFSRRFAPDGSGSLRRGRWPRRRRRRLHASHGRRCNCRGLFRPARGRTASTCWSRCTGVRRRWTH
jgi:hypothetical protein